MKPIFHFVRRHLISNRGNWILGLFGIFLLAWSLLLLLLSSEFDYSISLGQKPILEFFYYFLTAGTLFILFLYIISKWRDNSFNLSIIIAVGVLLRLILLFSNPILEDDYYRYLWDGAVFANGFNPYQYSPTEVISEDSKASQSLSQLKELSKESGDIIIRINHPYVRTIYPIITQLFFALAYLMKPWSLISWKIILLCMDGLILILLQNILSDLKLPSHWIIIYWWNPLLLKEIYNSAHMDVLIFPFLFLSLWSVTHRKFLLSAILLGLSANIKIWPILLFPIMFKPLFKKPLQYFGYAAIVIAPLSVTMLLAQPWQQLSSSAFFNYSTRWELNDSIFRIFNWICRQMLQWIDIHPGHSPILARGIVLIIVLGSVLYLTRKRNDHPLSLYQSGLILTFIIFLVSPTQFPWYALWIIPFLTLQPHWSLLMLTPLLSIYYLRYYLLSLNNSFLFDHYLVWIQYVPVWILLAIEWRKGRWQISQMDHINV